MSSRVDNQSNPSADFVTVGKKTRKGAVYVRLKIGEGKPSRHANLTASEARQVANLLVLYADGLSTETLPEVSLS